MRLVAAEPGSERCHPHVAKPLRHALRPGHDPPDQGALPTAEGARAARSAVGGVHGCSTVRLLRPEQGLVFVPAASCGTCSISLLPALQYVFADTPGQIEIFTWSASGSIVTEALATEFPTVVLFVVDTPRCAAPQTFMSNMLQACSILYKTRLPLVVAFNKVDAARHEPCVAWMQVPATACF